MAATATSTDECQFASLDELIAATDPQNGNYVIQLYGNILIHQKPGQPGAITAYQTDTKGKLHFIADVVSDCSVSQLSVSADGRYFGFIANDGDLTTANVYFLDTIDKTIDVAYSWSYTYCAAPTLFFSVNGQFVVFSPYADKLYIQPLYTSEPEVVFEALATETQPCNSCRLVYAQGPDYLVWQQPSGKLVVIDLVAGQQPAEWPLRADDNTWLPTKDSYCMFYNNYVIHIHNPSEQSNAKITILAVNSISQSVKLMIKFAFPELGHTWFEINSCGKSLTFHNNHKHRETRMSVLLPEIITNFID
jgi:hypothetical protein